MQMSQLHPLLLEVVLVDSVGQQRNAAKLEVWKAY